MLNIPNCVCVKHVRDFLIAPFANPGFSGHYVSLCLRQSCKQRLKLECPNWILVNLSID